MEATPVQMALFLLGLLAALGLSGILTGWVREQYRRGRHPLPYQPRRPVPWQAWHVLVLALLFILAPSLVHWIWQTAELPSPLGQTELSASPVGPPPVEWPLIRSNPPEQEPAHQVEQLLRQARGTGVWLAVVVMTLGAAPVVEEWLFRAVLQGWLEKVEWRLLRTLRSIWLSRAPRGYVGPWPQRPLGDDRVSSPIPHAFPPPIPESFPWRSCPRGRWVGWGPVIISSLIFAGLHFRTAGPPTPPSELAMLLICQGLGNLLSLVVGGAFLMVSCGARLADFGLSAQHGFRDIWRGLVAYLLVVGPVYVVMILTKIFLILIGASEIAPDPVPLFVLSLVLGGLYFRTHRLLTCIVLHMAFNATGLAVFLLLSDSG